MHTRSVQLPYFDSGVGEAIGYSHLTGAIDEWMVHQAARLRLGSSDYHLIRGVTLPIGNGTTRIDRIIVSQYGVFVIDTMNMRGKVFGGKEQRGWVLQTPKGKQAFANPLYQLYRRARLLVSMLGIDARKVFPMVVFVGGSTFKTPMPENVTRAGGYVRYIKSKSMPILTKADMARIVLKIEASQSDPLADAGRSRPARGGRESRRQDLPGLRQRHEAENRQERRPGRQKLLGVLDISEVHEGDRAQSGRQA